MSGGVIIMSSYNYLMTDIGDPELWGGAVSDADAADYRNEMAERFGGRPVFPSRPTDRVRVEVENLVRHAPDSPEPSIHSEIPEPGAATQVFPKIPVDPEVYARNRSG